MGNFLAFQWLEFRAFTAKGLGSLPGEATKIQQATQYGQKKRKKVKSERTFVISQDTLYLAKSPSSKCKGPPGSIPGQATRVHMPQLSSRATAKDPACHN